MNLESDNKFLKNQLNKVKHDKKVLLVSERKRENSFAGNSNYNDLNYLLNSQNINNNHSILESKEENNLSNSANNELLNLNIKKELYKGKSIKVDELSCRRNFSEIVKPNNLIQVSSLLENKINMNMNYDVNLKKRLLYRNELISKQPSKFQNIDYNIKFKAFANFLKNLNLSFEEIMEQIEGYIENLNKKYLAIYNNIKQQLEKEKNDSKRENSEKSNYLYQRNELEEIFFNCVQEIKKEIVKRKEMSIATTNLSNNNSIKFSSRDKILVLEQFISNPMISEKLHELIFEKQDKEVHFPTIQMPIVSLSPEYSRVKPKFPIQTNKSVDLSKSKRSKNFIIKGGKLKLYSINPEELDISN